MARPAGTKAAIFDYGQLNSDGEVDLRQYISEKMWRNMVPKAIKSVVNGLCETDEYYLDGIFLRKRVVVIKDLDAGTPEDIVNPDVPECTGVISHPMQEDWGAEEI